MTHTGLLAVAMATAIALATATPVRAVPRVPAGFVVDTVAAGLENPTAIATLPDGRLLVTEQPGRVRLIANGVLRPAPVWAAENEVLFEQEAGLVGIAVDPAYTTNHFLYFWYTVDPDSNGDDEDDGGAFGRLTRYTMRLDGSDTVDPASRTILLGTSFADAPITGTHTHTVGTLRWGSDGTLLLSHGDGDDWSQLDAGGLYPDVFEPGRADPAMDIGAWRSQSISSMNGKILRIDPATGRGLPSNPFWDGNPASNRSRVFAYGFRNPFRFAVRPGSGDPDPAHGNPGVLYVGDVGWYRWEELNVVPHSGLNFGWPAFEGLLPEIEYTASQPFRLGADSIGVTPDDPVVPTAPLAAWAHGAANSGVPGGFTGGANVGGVFYTGTRYPAQYRGRYFHADYGAQGGWIRAVTVTPDDRLISFDSFGTAMDAPVDLALEPGTGDVLYVSYFTGQLRRIRWTGAPETVSPPVAFGTGEPRLGLGPLSVQFRSAGSFDPDGEAITTHWDFGDGTTSDGVLDPVHVYATPGAYLASVTVTDAELATDRDTMTIVVVSTPVLPTTVVLDDFDRPDGQLGSPWTVDQPGLAILDGTLAASSPGSMRALWSEEFASTQEVWATIGPEAAASKRVALVLKASGLDPTASRVEVSYDPAAGAVLVTTDDLSFRKLSRGAPMPVTFAPGDRFGARCTTDGRIEVFDNGTRLGSVSLAGWPAVNATGQIGVWIEGPPAAAPVKEGERPRTLSLHYGRNDPRPGIPNLPQMGPVNGVFDDFGGGNSFIPGNRAPVVNLATPADSSFFDATGPIAFHGGATDDEDGNAELELRWTIVRHHTNRTDPPLVVFGTDGSFTPIDPGSEAGTWYEVVLAATDSEDATDSVTTRIFPKSNLVVTGLATNADHVEPGIGGEMGFWIRNDGPLVSTRSFWRALLDGISVDMEPLSIAGHDSAWVRIPLPALAAGPHFLRVVADTLRQCVETDESDNVALFAFTVGGEVGVDGDLPRTLALSSPMPNPAAGAVRFALDLPAASSVAFEVHDLQGRTLFRDPPRPFVAGRQVLQWDGRDGGGGRAAPGVYLARVQAGGRTFVRRIALVR